MSAWYTEWVICVYDYVDESAYECLCVRVDVWAYGWIIMLMGVQMALLLWVDVIRWGIGVMSLIKRGTG